MRLKAKGGAARGRTGRLAVLSAALILAAQLLGAVHSHRSALSRDLSARSEFGVDGGLCAVCLLAFHSPTNPGSAPAFARPQQAPERAAPAESPAIRSLFFPSPRGRAPPASV